MQEASSLSFPCLAMTFTSLLSFSSLAAWTRKDTLVEEIEEEEVGKTGWEDSTALGWYGNQVLEEKKKKKRNDKKQMESAADMTASSLESADLQLVQLHGCICIYMIPQNAVMCWDLRLAVCNCARVCECLCVCEHIHNIRWSDRRCLSRCTVHKLRMQLVEEDHVHCVNRDNSDLISLQADSLCILIGRASQMKPPPVSPHDWKHMVQSRG